MIRNQWYAVLESKEVRKGKLTGVIRLGERLVFWRNGADQVICLKDQCVHRGAALSAGKLEDGRVHCPFHGFQYDETGRVVLIPAIGKKTVVPAQFRQDAYPAAERHGFVFIFWGDASGELPPVPGFDDMDNRFSSITTIHPWPVHYSRAVENQLDLVHLPFVHYDTIGRGRRTLVNGPVERVTANREIEFWVYNEVDRGQTPKKAKDLPPPETGRQHIHFIFPNIWQNWILPGLRIIVAFVPVDEENSLIYMRTCQKFITIPGLRTLVNLLTLPSSIKILNQDKRVVITLIPGDLPIATYRRIRDALKQKR
jgi:phenylpropionate dioxygenase-like ring-hydroxylating dioxygenase large terminal subunit